MSKLVDLAISIFGKRAGSPFMFVGSGFSRRYIGIESWENLLRRFCTDIREFDYYFASADSNLPRTASLIAKDFHDVWWTSDKYASSRELFRGSTKNIQAALKNEISLYLSSADISGVKNEQIQKELDFLKHINVDGIITTNWDSLLEELFPEYKVFIGQEELLFSNPQAIAEIYKIHGCASEPDSLILTEEDYRVFEKKNPYLAAKLITLFIEHPIVFIGYSVNDPHVQSIIFSIASCLSDSKLAIFSENMIFVRRASGNGSSVQKVNFSRDGQSVSATVFETDDFCEVYTAIDSRKRRIPARVLRYCKEQIYELVKSSDIEQKIAVIDIDELDEGADVEFVVGIGVARGYEKDAVERESESKQILNEHGYRGVSAKDLFNDFLLKTSRFDAEKLLLGVFPVFVKSGISFIPVFRYLRDAGINSLEQLKDSRFNAAHEIVGRITQRGYQAKAYKSQYDKHWSNRSTSNIIAHVDPEKVALFVPFQEPGKIDRNALKIFLSENMENKFRDPYSSYFKKLVCLYDWIEYGFSEASNNI